MEIALLLHNIFSFISKTAKAQNGILTDHLMPKTFPLQPSHDLYAS